jgi:hypothetical protein
VYLVNARHMKGVPGKKTDVCDAHPRHQSRLRERNRAGDRDRPRPCPPPPRRLLLLRVTAP